MEGHEIKKVVREKYGTIAREAGSYGCSSTSCCSTKSASPANAMSTKVGYSEKELSSIPENANLGLGCGNPVAIALLKPGETVLDLGSGAGIDCFLAANKVGTNGRVIGVDMTQEMIDRARENATKGGYGNVEFRLGEIENLPVADSSVDVIISNCVISISPDKGRVFEESFRVLKPGGRLMVSDIVLLKELPQAIKNSIEAYAGCIGGAMLKEDYPATLTQAGFSNARITDETSIPVEYITEEMLDQLNISREDAKILVDAVLSIRVYAEK